MRVGFPAETVRILGARYDHLQSRSDIRRTLLKSDVVLLLFSSFCVWADLFGMRVPLNNVRPMLSGLRATINAASAYDEGAGNLRPDSLERLAELLSNFPLLKQWFGENIIVLSYVHDVFHSIRLSALLNKPALEVLEGMATFESAFVRDCKTPRSVLLDATNIHYMLARKAAGRWGQYVYYLNPETGALRLFHDRTSLVVELGEERAGEFYGGKINVWGNVLEIDGDAPYLLQNPQFVAQFLREKFKNPAYHFIARTRPRDSFQHAETFDKVWAKRAAAYPLGKTTDPRNWPIDDEQERVIAEGYAGMSNAELELEFLKLSTRKHPVISLKDTGFANAPQPLVAFLGSLDGIELDHHLRTPLALLIQLRWGMREEQSLDEGIPFERQIKYAQLIDDADHYKCFMREIAMRLY